MIRKVGIFLFFSLIAPGFLFAQICDETFLSNCRPGESYFKYTKNKASTAFRLALGGQNRFVLTLNNDMDYRIFICSDAVFNDIVKLVLKNSQGEELYNNAAHNYQQKVEFSNRVTQEVVFEISTPEPADIDSFKVQEGCIGLYIDQVKTPKTGF